MLPQGSILAAFLLWELRLFNWIWLNISCIWGFPGGSVVKNLPINAGDAGDAGSILGSGRSPVRGNGSPLQYSRLENPLDRGAWWARVHGVGHKRVGHDRTTEHILNTWLVMPHCMSVTRSCFALAKVHHIWPLIRNMWKYSRRENKRVTAASACC